jgi:phage FluMu gp28-like protein
MTTQALAVHKTEAPTVLLPYQQAWVADQSQVKICEKSRRVGISWAEACDAALTGSSSREAGGDDTWYIGYNQDMAKEFILDAAMWAKHYQLAASAMEESVFIDQGDDGDKHILTFGITFASGFRVTALSSRPSNLRGKQGRVVIDEAAFHNDLAGLIKAAMALLMWGGRVRIISTHDGDTNAFNEVVQDCRAGKLPYAVHRIEFNAAVEQGLYRRICLSTSKAWTPEGEAAWCAGIRAFYSANAAEELDVIPGTGAGSYLPRVVIESCMQPGIPVVRLKLDDGFTLLPQHIREAETRDWCDEHLAPLLAKLDPNLDHYFGEDFARTGDLTDIWPLVETRDLRLVTPFLLELRNVPFEQQKQILFYLVDRLPRFRAGAMDARGNGQYLAEVAMQRYGAQRIAQVMLSVAWYRENMPPLKAAFEDRSLVIPKDADVLGDLRSLKIVQGVAKVPDNGHTQGSDGLMRHGDSAIALAMAKYAVDQMTFSGACEGFESIPKRGQSNGSDDYNESSSRSMI